MSSPAISVVVIGRDEGQRLVRCLDSLKQIRGVEDGVEIVYVDSASKDGSPERAASYGAEVIVLRADRPSAALGRNAGWRAARGEYILFLDGDTVLHPDFVREARAEMEKDVTIAAVWGHRREMHPEHSIYNRILDLDWVYAPGVVEFCGGDVLMRRAVLEQMDGYDGELIAGEEPELCRRMRAAGYSILHIDKPMTGHDLQMTRWGQYWKRATRAGHAFAEVSRRFRNTADPFWDDERRKNLVRGGFWMFSFVFAVAVSAVLRSVWPFVLWVAMLAVLSLRSAWKSRWKSKDAATLLLYGIHSHLQQVPICIGQLRYEYDRRRGTRRTLIEYKEPSGAK
jgi:cellulose synthase/poly-beta-1,6-N-acetylglucosamine synthase-like glycosyltransferase